MDCVLPPLSELLDGGQVLRLPLATRFRGITERELVLLRGPYGWAEFSPFLEYDDPEASSWLQAAIDEAYLPRPGSAGLPDSVRVNATVPAVAAELVPGVLDRFPGCRTAKVKVAEPGQSLADDLARVAAVRRALGDGGRIRVDANGGWSVPDAVEALARLVEFGLEYAEQPVSGIDGLARLREQLDRRGTRVPIAADESVRKAADPLAVARAGAADVIVVKVQPLGGVRRAADIVRQAGLPATVSSALESSVGIAAGARLAALLAAEHDGGVQRFDAGLGTVSLFTDDVAAVPLRPRDGVIGTGPVAPAPAALRRLAAPPARREWWFDRIRRCYALLAAA